MGPDFLGHVTRAFQRGAGGNQTRDPDPPQALIRTGVHTFRRGGLRAVLPRPLGVARQSRAD